MRVFRRIIVLFIALGVIFAGCKEEVDEALQEITPVLDSEYYIKAKSLIEEAETSIEFMMYLVSDTIAEFGKPGELLLSISDAYSQGVDVRVLLHNIGDITNEKAVSFFKNRGIPVKIADKYSHTKLLVIDEESVLLGSHNWTSAAFASNYEASVLIRDEATASLYRDYFNEHYDRGIEPE